MAELGRLGIAGLLLSGCGQKRCHSRGSMSRLLSRALVGVPRFASGQFVKTKDTASSRDRNGPVVSCSGDQTWKTPQNSWTSIGQSTSSSSTPSDPCSVVQTVTESFAIASVMRSLSELAAVLAFSGLAAESLDVGLPCHPAPSTCRFQWPESRVIGFKSEDVPACSFEVVLDRSILVQFGHSAPNHLMKAQDGSLRLTVEQVVLPHFR
jgi:hypothetical protein